MEDDDLIKYRQISAIFKEKFQSSTVQEDHQVYLDELRNKLNIWKSETNDKLRQFINDKSDEIDEFYDQYCQEMNNKYENLKEQIENQNSSSNIDDQIENFKNYCQLNTIENCLHLNTKMFSIDQLADNIQLEYILYPDPSSGRTIESSYSPVTEKRIEPSESFIRRRTTEPSDSSPTIKERTSESPKSVTKRRSIEPLDTSVEERKTVSPEFIIRKRTLESVNPPDTETRPRSSRSIISRRRRSNSSEPSVSERTSESPKSITKRRSIEPLESPIEERKAESPESETKRRSIEPLESPIEERRTDSPKSETKRRSIEPLESPIEERKTESPKLLIRRRKTTESSESLVEERKIGSPESIIRRETVETPDSPISERRTSSPKPTINRSIIEPLDAPVTKRTESPEHIIRRRTVESDDSPIEERRNDSPESINKKKSTEPLDSPVTQRRTGSSESLARKRTIEPTDTSIKEKTNESPESTVKIRTREPSYSIIKDKHESIQSPYTSSRASPIPVPISKKPPKDRSNQIIHHDRFLLRPEPSPSKEESFIPLRKSHVITTTNNNVPKTPTRLYVGEHDVLTPVLVGKDREVYNDTEKIIEYSIDSISVPQDKQDQSLPINLDNDEMKIVHAYKVLIQEENDYQQFSISSSDHEGEGEGEEDEDEHDDDDDELSNINNKFNLKKFDQINYSTIMFRECETEYNCISSSTKRNELILYNSKLKVLIILQHDNFQQCRNRFYLNWPKNLSPFISDITYCENIDQFFISTWDTNHIYLFNRHLLSLIDLGILSNYSPLRRIHYYHQTLYCILSNNYLLECQIDKQYSKINICEKIKLYNPYNYSQDTVYHLLDITCDKNYLIIIYSNEHDEIHLQSIYRQTKEFHQDLLLDIRQPINQNYIRIESTYINGNFLYLNGSQQHLKTIDLVNFNKGKITSVMHRHTKPTNICFLRDQRLVILYEQPYFLSVHDLNTRQELN